MDVKEIVVVGLCLWQFFVVSMVSGSLVFKLEHNFKGEKRSLKELKDHDARRHGRLLASNSIKFPFGGDANPTEIGLYYTKIQVGNPAKEFHLQVDTGSDVMWLHGNGCEGCPSETRIKDLKLQSYDPKGSSSAKLINCDKEQCKLMTITTPDENCNSDKLCQYLVRYGDGSSITGYYVEDSLTYSKTSSGNQQSNVVFGCATKYDGPVPSLVDGLIGFGQANTSVISQLAAAGKVKKRFSHCLDNKKGGGILAIGELVEPKLTTSPIIEKQDHYNVVLESIDVDGEVVDLSKDSGERGAIIDSGATLGYLPKEIHDLVMKKISSRQPDLKYDSREDGFKCFKYSGKFDDDFPKVVMKFNGSLTLTSYPHEYLFQLGSDEKWCIGWQSSGFQSKDGKDVTILGDMVLQNRLVYYDLDNQTIGWTDHDCSTSIKLKDEESGNVNDVGAENLIPPSSPPSQSSARSLISARSVLLSFLFALINQLFTVRH